MNDRVKSRVQLGSLFFNSNERVNKGERVKNYNKLTVNVRVKSQKRAYVTNQSTVIEFQSRQQP